MAKNTSCRIRHAHDAPTSIRCTIIKSDTYYYVDTICVHSDIQGGLWKAQLQLLEYAPSDIASSTSCMRGSHYWMRGTIKEACERARAPLTTTGYSIIIWVRYHTYEKYGPNAFIQKAGSLQIHENYGDILVKFTISSSHQNIIQ